MRTPLVVQWLRLHIITAWGRGGCSILGRVSEIPRAVQQTKTKMKKVKTCRDPAYCILSAYYILSAALAPASSFRIWNSSTRILSQPGASVRSSTHDKGHEERGSTYAKAGSSLRGPPGNSRAFPPKTRVCLLSALCSHLQL